MLGKDTRLNNARGFKQIMRFFYIVLSVVLVRLSSYPLNAPCVERGLPLLPLLSVDRWGVPSAEKGGRHAVPAHALRVPLP